MGLKFLLIPLFCLLVVMVAAEPVRRPHLQIRGLYGGFPGQIFARGQTLADYGVNAVWIGSGRLNHDEIARLKAAGARVFAEFNTLHEAGYLRDHPDAAPIGPDGEVCPPPDGWQGICPTHPGYRRYRMEAFRAVLRDFAVDGIWLDYHHAHAAWERAEPILPDTCFCPRCLAAFERETGRDLPEQPIRDRSRLLLGPLRREWIDWRCRVLTDWVREFHAIRNETRPQALLGTFHCPWSDTERDGALRNQLHIDLRAQARYLDVFSPMPYHARFGHAQEPEWISRQVRWLGQYLGIRGEPGERLRIWPIVQLSDWGEPVPVEQIETVLDHGTRPPATGVIVFAWGGLHPNWAKVEAIGRFYRAVAASAR